MIARRIKLEEYREIKPYWMIRLVSSCGILPDGDLFNITPIPYDIIRATNGYSKSAPTMDVEFKGLTTGPGKQEWGGGGENKFIISLGEIISIKNWKDETHPQKS